MYRNWCDARVYIPGKYSVPDVVFVRELVRFGGFGGNEMRYACLAGGVPRVSSFSIHKVEASSCFPDAPFSIVLRTKKKKNMPLVEWVAIVVEAYGVVCQLHSRPWNMTLAT